MDLGNCMRAPAEQPQPLQLQAPQRKRPRNPPLSPLMPTQESNMASSSRPTKVGTASEEPLPKSVYEAWTEASEDQMFQWFELPGNYDKWKCAGVRTSSGSTRTSKLTKKGVTSLISQYLDTVQIKKTPEQVMSKMRYMEKKFKEAEDLLRNTGEGLTSNDEKMGITRIRDKVLSICPFYYKLKPFMAESVAFNPPYIGKTGMNEDISNMLVPTSNARGLHDSRTEEAADVDFEEDYSSADDEEPDFEEQISSQQEPIPQPPSQGSEIYQEKLVKGLAQQVQVNLLVFDSTRVSLEAIKAILAVMERAVEDPSAANEHSLDAPAISVMNDTTTAPETAQGTTPPNRHRREKKRKAKSFQESVQDIQEQNGKLMEKKLAMQSAHQDEKLRFLRKQSQQQYLLDSRRLELEFMRMEQQREDSRIREQQQREDSRIRELALQVELQNSRIRELALQVELQKLRGKS